MRSECHFDPRKSTIELSYSKRSIMEYYSNRLIKLSSTADSCQQGGTLRSPQSAQQASIGPD